MNIHQRALRIGAGAIALALALRLISSGAFADLLQNEDFFSFLIYLETGRVVRFSPSLEETGKFAGESPAPSLSSQIRLPVYSREDAAALRIWNVAGIDVDTEALLTRDLNWNLVSELPTVLILHTHATESYTKNGEDYAETSAYRTLNEEFNMLSIGDCVAQRLEQAGIRVVHDRTLHDYPSYNGSYTHARQSIRDYLKEYPSVLLVLDLHRDASGDLDNQFRPTAQVGDKTAAQLMLVMGSDVSGQSHPDWQTNLALGLKLQTQLEALAPGITRPVCLRSQRFNQDMTPGSLLIEVGAAGNTHGEAMLAAQILADAIISLSHGTG